MALFWNDDRKEILITYLRNGLNRATIAKKMNVTPDAIDGAIRRYNLSQYSAPKKASTPKFLQSIDFEELNDNNFEDAKKDAILRWKIKEATKAKKAGQFQTALFWSDTHIPHHNEPACKAILKLMNDIRFDKFIVAGDFMDLGCIGHWDRNKHRKLELKRLKNDYIIGNSLLDEIDSRLPKNCDKHYLMGNHEEWADQLLEEMPALEGLIEPESMLNLKQRKYSVLKYNELLKIGRLYVTHGIYAGANPIKKHLDELKVNCLFGHTHTLGMRLASSAARDIAFAGYNIGCVCYDEKTEVLTPDGWKYLKELEQGEKILGYNPTTKIAQYEYPLAKQIFNYSGKLHHYTSDRLDLLVTPEHKMLYKNSCNNLSIKSSKELFAMSKLYGIPVSGKMSGYTDITLSTIKLLAWIITEGCLTLNDDRITIFQKKEPYRTEIRNLLIAEKIEFTERVDKRSQCAGFRICVKDSRKLLRLFDNENIKRIPRQILNSDYRTLNLFFAEMMKGDGTTHKQGTRVYATKFYDLANDVAELLHKIGSGAKIKKEIRNTNKKQNATIYLITEHRTEISTVQNKELIDYSGNVYDVTMPSGFLYVRRNGKIAISGNCDLSPDYMKNRPNSWTHGFAIGYFFPNGFFDIQLIRIVQGKFIYGDKIYDGNTR